MRAKYHRNKDFLQYNTRPTDSPVWKSILKCRQLLRKGMIWKIGIGNEISFCYDNWIDTQSLRDILKLDKANNLDPNIKVSDFIQNYQWDQTFSDHPIIKNIIGSRSCLRMSKFVLLGFN